MRCSLRVRFVFVMFLKLIACQEIVNFILFIATPEFPGHLLMAALEI